MNNPMMLTGLFGCPVGHSMSPSIHNAAFDDLKLNYRYVAFSVPPGDLQDAVKGIRVLGFRGVNVTIPHKVEVMKYLDEIDEEAVQIGAVNTIVNVDGKLIGYNTDGQGYVQSLLEEWNTELQGKRVVMLGAGGAARGVAVTLAKRGVDKVVIANRSQEHAQFLAQHLSKWTQAEAISLETLENRGMREVDLLINTTPVGMSPHIDEMPISSKLLHPQLMVSDLIYNPLETMLLREARKAGAKVHSGVGMFVHQGALAFEHWTGKSAPIDLMRKVVLERLKS